MLRLHFFQNVQADRFYCKKLPGILPSPLRPSQPAGLKHLKPPSGHSATPELLYGCVLLCAEHGLRTVSELTHCDIKILTGKMASGSF